MDITRQVRHKLIAAVFMLLGRNSALEAQIDVIYGVEGKYEVSVLSAGKIRDELWEISVAGEQIVIENIRQGWMVIGTLIHAHADIPEQDILINNKSSLIKISLEFENDGQAFVGLGHLPEERFLIYSITKV